jgi:hypothetical protein
MLLDPYEKHKLNYNEGDTLKLDIREKFNIDGFDAVIGNPPYNDSSGNKGRGHTLWDRFVNISLDDWLNESGLLLYVHPSSWRQKDNKILIKFKEKQVHYLEIHNVEDGIKTFRCSTRYDWYLLENIKKYKDTIVKDEEGFIFNINFNDWLFIPNMLFDKLKVLYHVKIN